MRFIIRNICLFIKNETFLAVSVAICIMTSSWAMLFAYGVFQNFNAAKKYGDETVWEIRPQIMPDAEFTVGDFIRYAEAIPAETGNNIAIICADFTVDGWYEQSGFPSPLVYDIRVAVRDNRIVNSGYLLKLWEKQQLLKSGRFPTDEEQIMGANVAVVEIDSLDPTQWNGACIAHKVGENSVELFGKEYEVIGTADIFGYISVPVKTLPPDLRLNSFVISFGIESSDYNAAYRLTKKDFGNIVSTAEEIIPDVFGFEDIMFPDNDSVTIYNNVIIVSVLIALLTVINFAATYLFIIRSRRRQIAVMSLCGASGRKIFRIYLGECCLITMPLFLLGEAAFAPFMKNVLADIFPYMADAFTPFAYLVITGIYFVTMTVIISAMLFAALRGKTAAMLKEGAL